jgi:hypothetical protein
MKQNRRGADRGFSLVEAAMGAALLSAAGLVICGLFTAGIKTYRDSMTQLSALMSARELFEGRNPQEGLLAAALQARSFSVLQRAELSLVPSQGSSLRYYLTGTNLYRSQMDQPVRQAKDIKALEFRYYAMGADGRLTETFDPSQASMAVAFASFPGKAGKSVHVLAGSSLRNRS